MGQKKKYSKELLHPVLNMGKYFEEVEAGSVSAYRTKVLKERFANVKKIAFSMYRDAYELIQKIDGESMQDPEFLWKHDLQSIKIFCESEDSYGDYSKKNLHPIRHFEEYLEEVNAGNITPERLKTLKKRLAVVLRLAVRLYYDAERLIRKLD